MVTHLNWLANLSPLCSTLLNRSQLFRCLMCAQQHQFMVKRSAKSTVSCWKSKHHLFQQIWGDSSSIVKYSQVGISSINWVFIFVTSKHDVCCLAYYRECFLSVTSNPTENDSATQEEQQQIEKVLDATAVDTGESSAKSQGLLNLLRQRKAGLSSHLIVIIVKLKYLYV